MPAERLGLLVPNQDGIFRFQDGSPFQHRGFTDFSLFYKFINGIDINPILNERRSVGANALRVSGMVDSFNHFYPKEYPDYYSKLEQFQAKLFNAGFYLKFTVFADAQIIMPNYGEQDSHLDLVVWYLGQSRYTTFIEICNEPFKNMPPTGQGGEDRAIELALRIKGRYPNLLIASGSYTNWPPQQCADYNVHHADRDNEWVRKSKDIRDLWEVTKVPWISDEPMGAAETNQPGKRSNVPLDFGYFSSTAALEGAGATFHSDDGILSNLLSPIQKQCAIEFFNRMKWVTNGAGAWVPYQRGAVDDNGNPIPEGIGNMPILHDDKLELRSFCKTDGSIEECVQLRTTRSNATPRDGWIITEDNQGFIKLKR